MYYARTTINDNIDIYTSINRYKSKLMCDRRSKYYDIQNMFAKKLINAIFLMSFILMIVLGITSSISNMLFLLMSFWVCVITFNIIIKITEQILKPF